MTPATSNDGAGGHPIQVVLGPCTDLRAEVFVRAAIPADGGRLRLEGTLAGPECRRSITLPVAAGLADMGRGPAGPLARAVLTEPAFWTPDLPNLYRLSIRLKDDGNTVAEVNRWIGLRRSGVRGRSLWLEGRRWVPRGVVREPGTCDVLALRTADVAAMLTDPPEPLLSAADEAGLAVIALTNLPLDRPPPADQLVDRIAAWGMHPSVVIAVLPATLPADTAASLTEAVRRLKGTMLIARVIDGALPPPDNAATGSDCLLVSLAENALPHAAWRDPKPAVPLIAWRRCADEDRADRSGCDRLQAALAAWRLADGRTHQPWDWAGYVGS